MGEQQSEDGGLDLDALMAEQRTVTGTEIFDLPGADEAGPGSEDESASEEPEGDDEQGPSGGEEERGSKGSEAENPDQPPNSGEGEKELNTRFTTHEEAERGYRELQAKSTRDQQELARLKKEKAEREAAEVAARHKEKADAATLEFSKKRHAEILGQISALDEEDPDYDTKVAGLWAEVNFDVTQYAQNPEIEEEVGGTPLVSGDANPPEDTRPEEPGGGHEDVLLLIDRAVQAAEFDDGQRQMFMGYASQAPDKDDQGVALNIDQQVAWAVKQTQNYYSGLKAKIEQEVKAQLGQPMGRGGTGVTPRSKADDAKPLTLDGALEAAEQARTL